MLALLQRVTESRVSIDERVVGHIGMGLLVFVGVGNVNHDRVRSGRVPCPWRAGGW